MSLPKKPASVKEAEEMIRSGKYGEKSVPAFELKEAQADLAEAKFNSALPSFTVATYPKGYDPRNPDNGVEKTFTVDNIDEIPNGEYWFMNQDNKWEWKWVDPYKNLRTFLMDASAKIQAGAQSEAEGFQRPKSESLAAAWKRPEDQGKVPQRPGVAGKGKTILTGGTGVKDAARIKRQKLGS